MNSTIARPAKLKTYTRAVVRNSVNPKFTYTVEATAKGWKSYQRNYRIPASAIVSVTTFQAARLSGI